MRRNINLITWVFTSDILCLKNFKNKSIHKIIGNKFHIQHTHKITELKYKKCPKFHLWRDFPFYIHIHVMYLQYKNSGDFEHLLKFFTMCQKINDIADSIMEKLGIWKTSGMSSLCKEPRWNPHEKSVVAYFFILKFNEAWQLL